MTIKDGTKVKIMAGDCKDSNGTVVGYHNHDPVTYAVMLDEPVKKTITRDIDIGGGRKAFETEDVVLSRIEVAEADLSFG